MTCDYCHQPMNYSFYINDAHWIKVVGEEKFDKTWATYAPTACLKGWAVSVGTSFGMNQQKTSDAKLTRLISLACYSTSNSERIHER